MEQIDTKHPPNLAIMPKITVRFFGLIFFMFWYIIVCVGIKTAYIGTPTAYIGTPTAYIGTPSGEFRALCTEVGCQRVVDTLFRL